MDLQRIIDMKWFTPYILRGLVFVEGLFNWHPDGPAKPALYPALCPSTFVGELSSQNRTNTSVSDGPWAPWTHEPRCVTSVADPSIIFCVYTKADYGINGISIIAKARPFDASVKACEENELPVLYMAPPRIPEEPRSYEVVDVEGKGKGTVATRQIRAGETIMTDDVTLLFDKSMSHWIGETHGNDLLDTALNQLPHPEVLTGLHRVYRGESVRDPVQGLIDANGFGVNVNISNTAILPEIARINHDCRANAYRRLPGNRLIGSVVAHRDIAEGEEITISYLPPGLSHQRRSKMLERWGFECSCAICTAPAEEFAESDNRRRRLHDLKQDAYDASFENRTAQAVGLTEESLALLQEEGLMMAAGWRYKFLARWNTELGREEEAEKYQKLADEWNETYLGGDLDAIARV